MEGRIWGRAIARPHKYMTEMDEREDLEFIQLLNYRDLEWTASSMIWKAFFLQFFGLPGSFIWSYRFAINESILQSSTSHIYKLIWTVNIE